MKKLAILGLVVLILLAGMPLAMGMSAMHPCPECPATTVWSLTGLCAAVLTFFALLIALASRSVTMVLAPVRPLLLVRRVDRPPRLV